MPFQRPTTTPTPDELFDVWLKKLSESELKVLLYIVRRTLGFRKHADAISYDQFLHGITTHEGRVLDEGCLTHRTTLKRALDGLEEKGLIRAQRSKTALGDSDITLYSLAFEGDEETPLEADPRSLPPRREGSAQTAPPWSADGTTPSAIRVPEVVRKRHPQETVQQTERQRRDTRPPRLVPGEDRRGPERFTSGTYGPCPHCLSSPHEADCPSQQQKEA